MDTCDTHAIAQLMRTEDPVALERVTRCYGARLLSIARQACRLTDDAEDAVQDALIEAANGMGSYRGEGSPLSWLSTLVVRRCHRIDRRKRNDPTLHVRDQVTACSCHTPEGNAQQRELAERRAQALQALEPLDRSIVVLAHDGGTGPQIAAELGLTANAVRSRLKRARRRLRTALDDVAP